MKVNKKEEIIKQMKSHYKKYGEISSRSFEMDKETFSVRTVRKYFDTWNNAKKIAELDSGHTSKKWEEKLIKLIRSKVETGELKNMSQIGRIKGLPTYRYLKTIWTIEEMEKLFGLKIKRCSYSAKEVEESYKQVRQNHEIVTLLLMKEEGGICSEVIRRHFGTWNKFLIHMGEKPGHVITNVTHTDEELIELYKDFSYKLGKRQYGATSRDLKDYDFPYSKSVLASRFTSINNLRRLAGFDIKNEVIPKYSKHGLKLLLYKNYKRYGRRLSQTEIAKDEELPNPSSIFYYFQTTKITEVWNEVLNVK